MSQSTAQLLPKITALYANNSVEGIVDTVHIEIEVGKLLESQKSSLLHQLQEKVEARRKKSGKESRWVCPANSGHCLGYEGDYCHVCRRKLVERVEIWETEEDNQYNEALDDIKSLLSEEES